MKGTLSVCLLLGSVLASYVHIATAAGDSGPEVTLSHGGILRGIDTSFHGVQVDVFLGIRYAKAPTGDLRFKKTELYPSWQGVKETTKIGGKCPHVVQGEVIGDEDCLFMDITVPRQGATGAKKAVMVWLHGGAFAFGTGSIYIGTPLAVLGDVIVVTFNYRVGMLGFLYDGPGTGNYGLWDQRAALLWVKQNIEQFGGDPDLVTIFGESAGAGSVSAQAMGQHNDGLFMRAIMQSGTLYQMLPMQKSKLRKMIKSVREQTGCTSSGKVYECLADKTTADLLTTIKVDPTENYWHPVSDNDFFSSDVDEYSYKLTQRFDLMAGMNGQEGGIMLAMDTGMFAMMMNGTIENGLSMEFTRFYLTIRCRNWFTPYSAELCADFVIHAYELDKAENDKDRLLRLTSFLSEAFFDADISNKLEQHSSGDKSTYGYYFTELIPTGNVLWKIPEWARKSPDHADELPFVFGGAYYKEEENPLWEEILSTDLLMSGVLVGTAGKSEKPLTLAMMTMWSNFAKTGNPNLPVALPAGTPTWPEFNTDANQFIELNSKQMRVITTPNKDRLDRLRAHLFSARNLQFAAELPEQEGQQQPTEVTDDKSRHGEL